MDMSIVVMRVVSSGETAGGTGTGGEGEGEWVGRCDWTRDDGGG